MTIAELVDLLVDLLLVALLVDLLGVDNRASSCEQSLLRHFLSRPLRRATSVQKHRKILNKTVLVLLVLSTSCHEDHSLPLPDRNRAARTTRELARSLLFPHITSCWSSQQLCYHPVPDGSLSDRNSTDYWDRISPPSGPVCQTSYCPVGC